MLENLRNYLYYFLHKYGDCNTPFTVAKTLLLDYGTSEQNSLFTVRAGVNDHIRFIFTNQAETNRTCLLESEPDFFANFESEIVPSVEQQFPVLKGADLSDPQFWEKLMDEYLDSKENDESMLRYAKNSPEMYSMSFPHTNNEVKPYSYGYSLKFFNIFKNSPNIEMESELIDFAKMFFATMIATYKKRFKAKTKFPPSIKEVMLNKIRHFEEFYCKMFNLPQPEPEQEVQPYTKEELEMQKVWAEQFEDWWESEGQYHRAGGSDYEKTFAWWAWLNREQQRQKTEAELIQRIRELEAKLQG